ncbi:MAG: outer membrane protein transport protein [Legionella sp.]|nr:outer membrane protein transport protein [Legionella sp.]
MFARLFWATPLYLPLILHASFIESTIGTTVVEDATATYYNPAALAGVKKKQGIALGSASRASTVFTGQYTRSVDDYVQSGTSTAHANTLLPSLFYTMPLGPKIYLGTAIFANDILREVDGFSILKYVQSNNRIDSIGFIPALAVQLNKKISIGAFLNRTHAAFLFEPLTGFPKLNIPDIKSRNKTTGESWGWDIGLLMKPLKSTTIGLNHRAALNFRMHGTSQYNGLIADDYSFNYSIPSRTILSLA